ncbi:hypothetical protein F0562_006263 [Nyssa sinensis]|uniref:Uncharacterized protein n=1 Tax=Nyssa sinensis TaxID=561372 RepID=A0A5J5AMM7_9ASTE|nr:hypothetical protein F0562_006263 [Nyssa sinensis]
MSVSPDFLASSLYCDEAVHQVISSNTLLSSFDSDDESFIVDLFDLELEHMPEYEFVRQLGNFHEVVTARYDSIIWMFKVHAYYNFRPRTAYLSVNYLDRFLSSNALPQGERWPWQLLSVACLSLAAKMEETRVPLLLDLQVLEPKFIFKPKTVQRMELLVMASLKWRLRVITPFDFVDHFTAKLQCFNTQFDQFRCIFSEVSDLILSTCPVIDSLDYTPSTIAMAAVLWATGQNLDDHKTISFHERVSNEMVQRCHHLFKEILTCNKQQLSGPSPPSPIGVLDAASGSGSSNFRGWVRIKQIWEDSEVSFEANENQRLSSSKEGKANTWWKKVKYQLVEYHSLPGYLKDNEYIVGHYRSEWPLKQVLLSIFTIHNETLNVWTHLIGFLLFLFLTIYTAMKLPKVVDMHSLQNFPDVLKKADLHKLHAELMACLPSLPNMPDLQRLREELTTSLPSMDLLPSLSNWHIVELLTNCLPERFSNGNHTDVCVLRSMKEDVANIIAPLMMTTPITRWPFFAFLVFQKPEYHTMRASLFFAMGMSGAAPILHKLVIFWHRPEALHTTGYEILMGAFYGIGALVYAMRIPERWMPGKASLPQVAGPGRMLRMGLVLPRPVAGM